jgi:hypothetical protein
MILKSHPRTVLIVHPQVMNQRGLFVALADRDRVET